ncbi:MAG: hypothetical protein JO149_08200 [Gammaproteobacteria bacterium]|nr:hypothetical protein [Gammaproteobacteria bacterium]
MSQENDISFDYTIAQGPEGLIKVLNDLLEKPDAQKSAQYILYQLGNQKSLIKVDISMQPFQFWYYDLLGRPATKVVKDVLGNFVWEKGGEKERFLKELAARGES